MNLGIHYLGYAKVANLDNSSLVEKNICRLKISKNDGIGRDRVKNKIGFPLR